MKDRPTQVIFFCPFHTKTSPLAAGLMLLVVNNVLYVVREQISEQMEMLSLLKQWVAHFMEWNVEGAKKGNFSLY